jgi:hypothetical protein
VFVFTLTGTKTRGAGKHRHYTGFFYAFGKSRHQSQVEKKKRRYDTRFKVIFEMIQILMAQPEESACGEMGLQGRHLPRREPASAYWLLYTLVVI